MVTRELLHATTREVGSIESDLQFLQKKISKSSNQCDFGLTAHKH